MLFHVDEAGCERCGSCAAVCPMGIVEWQDRNTVPQPADTAERLCINCGHCLAVCPHGALSLAAMPVGDCPRVESGAAADFASFSALVRGRRSVRAYLDRPVAREDIAACIDTARHAPTGKNTQLLHWLVIQGREQLDPLVDHCINWMRDMLAKKHPMARQFGMEGVIAARDAGADPVLRSAPCLVVVSGPRAYPGAGVDSVIALTTFELAAASRGLGTCWAGFFHLACSMWPPLIEALGLPDGHAPGFSMMVGHPKYRYKRIPMRKQPEVDWRM